MYITMSDNYEFEGAMQSQATDEYSPYVDKQANGYTNDINNGVYIIINAVSPSRAASKSCCPVMASPLTPFAS